MPALDTNKKFILFDHKMQKLPNVANKFCRTRIFDSVGPIREESGT